MKKLTFLILAAVLSIAGSFCPRRAEGFNPAQATVLADHRLLADGLHLRDTWPSLDVILQPVFGVTVPGGLALFDPARFGCQDHLYKPVPDVDTKTRLVVDTPLTGSLSASVINDSPASWTAESPNPVIDPGTKTFGSREASRASGLAPPPVFTTWTESSHTDLTAATITNSPGAAGSTMFAGLYKDWDACWFTAGGSVLTIPVTAGGTGYTTAPTVGGLTSNGSSSRKVAAVATSTLSGTSVSTIVLSNLGRDFPTPPTATLSGGGGSGATLGTPTLSGHVLESINGSAPASTAFGANGYFTYTGTTSADQRFVGTFLCTASTDQLAVILRADPTNRKLYSFFVRASGQANIWYFDSYTGSSGTNDNLSGTSTFTALTVGHSYSIDAQAVGSALTLVLSDVTTPATVATLTATDTRLASGSIGLGLCSTLSAWTDLKTYVLGDLVVSPATTGLNQTGLSVDITAFGTTWLSAAPTFTTTAGTITTTNVVDDTHATLTFSTGATVANATITDTTTSKTGQLSLVAQIAPAASISAPYSSTSPVIAAATYPTYGNAPFTARLYRSANSAFAYDDGTATLVSTQTGLAASTIPTSVTDSSPPAGVKFYRWVITDATAQVTSGVQTAVVVPVAITPSYRVGAIGDSITLGHDATELIQQVVDPVVVSGGSGYSGSPTVTVPAPSNGGRTATVVAVVSGGSVINAYVTDAGWGYTTEATLVCTVSGGGGTGAAISVNTGGGYPLALQDILRSLYGFRNLVTINCARGGQATTSWTPHGTGSASNTGYLLERAKASFVSPAQTPIVILMLGANDANASLPKATYKSNLVLTLNDLTQAGYKVVLMPPTYWSQAFTTEAKINLLQQYGAAVRELVLLYPNKVFLGGDNNFSLFLSRPELLFAADGLHLNNAGYYALAAGVAPVIAKLLGYYGGAQGGNGFLLAPIVNNYAFRE